MNNKGRANGSPFDLGFFRIRLSHIGETQQIIGTCLIICSKFDDDFQRNDPLTTLVFGIQGLIAGEIVCDLLLCQKGGPPLDFSSAE